ncbi:uncharacterized protein [Primulina eburnea]|uniref:uncharacterized protein n=1 Tax=Primulina eburnea TaxID=1245227 RepID=UPI003C6BF4F2
MARLVFDYNWTAKVMNCVTSVSYFFRVNQEIAGPIKPGRGLQQGDPLSPYLFVLCAHSLSTLIDGCEVKGLFKGVKISSASPSVSHLFFADDSLVRTTMEEGAHLKECLSLYGRLSEKLINYDKSASPLVPIPIHCLWA